jgi:hypothetical protein
VKSWRAKWAAAQTTGVVFSSLVWIVVCGLSFPALAVTSAVGIALVVGRNTQPLLWWRFGAAPANDFERNAVLTAIIPIASLRGRRQPSIWIGRRVVGGLVVMPSRTVVVVSPEFVRRVSNGQLSARQASAIISRALGHCQLHDSSLVNAVEGYCAPWRFVQVFTGVASQLSTRTPMLGLSWKIRWIVFGAAIVDSYRNARWAALVGVLVIAVLSWSTGYFQKRWTRELEDLGDDCADQISPTSSNAATGPSPQANAPADFAARRRGGRAAAVQLPEQRSNSFHTKADSETEPAVEGLTDDRRPQCTPPLGQGLVSA